MDLTDEQWATLEPLMGERCLVKGKSGRVSMFTVQPTVGVAPSRRSCAETADSTNHCRWSPIVPSPRP
jgi:hypothetical protein